MLRCSALGTSTTPEWHFRHCDSVWPRAIICRSQYRSSWYSLLWVYLPHSFSCSRVLGVCAAFWKPVARPRPWWQAVQPTFSIGWGPRRKVSRSGWVRKGWGAFSYPFLSMARWQVVQRSTFGVPEKFTSSTRLPGMIWLILREGLARSRMGRFRTK